MKWKMISNQNFNTIDNIEDNTFIESSEEKDTYLEYMIEKILQKLDFKQKESCKVFSINEVADMLKVSKRTIEGHLYDKKDLPYLKIGRKVRIKKSTSKKNSFMKTCVIFVRRILNHIFKHPEWIFLTIVLLFISGVEMYLTGGFKTLATMCLILFIFICNWLNNFRHRANREKNSRQDYLWKSE